MAIYEKFMTLPCTVPSKVMILDNQMAFSFEITHPCLARHGFIFLLLPGMNNYLSFSLKINRQWIDGVHVFISQIFIACLLCGSNCLTCNTTTHLYLMDGWQQIELKPSVHI